MSSFLLLQQCPSCLIRLILVVFVMGGRWPYLLLLLLWRFYRAPLWLRHFLLVGRWCYDAFTVTISYVITQEWWFRVYFLHAENFSLSTKSNLMHIVPWSEDDLKQLSNCGQCFVFLKYIYIYILPYPRRVEFSGEWSYRVAISVYYKPLHIWIEVSVAVERMYVNNSNCDS